MRIIGFNKKLNLYPLLVEEISRLSGGLVAGEFAFDDAPKREA